MKEASHDPGCDALDVDPSIGRSTKPCNCRNRSAKAESEETANDAFNRGWNACREMVEQLGFDKTPVLIKQTSAETGFTADAKRVGRSADAPEIQQPDVPPNDRPPSGDTTGSGHVRLADHPMAAWPGSAEPERGSREYRRIHGPACGCPRCRGDEDEPVQATEDDFVEVLERDLDRVKVLLGLDPVHDGIAQMITLLEKRTETPAPDGVVMGTSVVRTAAQLEERHAAIAWLVSIAKGIEETMGKTQYSDAMRDAATGLRDGLHRAPLEKSGGGT